MSRFVYDCKPHCVIPMLPATSLLFPVAFVLPLYLSPTSLPRGHPRTVRARILISTLFSVCFSWVPTYIKLRAARSQGVRMDEVLMAMGLRTTGLFRAIITPLLLTCFLFLGPLAMSFPHTLFRRRDLSKLVAIRNLIVAPLTEELWFRSGLVSYLLASGVPLTTCLWMSPILFAMSHVHHVYDLIAHQSWHPVDAIMACLGQAGYTTVFGWYATFVYLRTGHLSAVICLHAFCNHMGFPQFGAISIHPRAEYIATAYAIGIAIFAVGLLPLTNPALYGYPHGTSYASQFDR